MRTKTSEIIKQADFMDSSVFKFRAASALVISVVADALDYFAAPFFGLPIVGDIFDAIVVSILFSISKSKMSAAINMIEFIPVIGDFIPVYTLSTLLWISKEWNSQRNYSRRTQKPSSVSSISAFFTRKR